MKLLIFQYVDPKEYKERPSVRPRCTPLSFNLYCHASRIYCESPGVYGKAVITWNARHPDPSYILVSKTSYDIIKPNHILSPFTAFLVPCSYLHLSLASITVRKHDRDLRNHDITQSSQTPLLHHHPPHLQRSSHQQSNLHCVSLEVEMACYTAHCPSREASLSDIGALVGTHCRHDRY
jgi:hypothetical protein